MVISLQSSVEAGRLDSPALPPAQRLPGNQRGLWEQGSKWPGSRAPSYSEPLGPVLGWAQCQGRAAPRSATGQNLSFMFITCKHPISKSCPILRFWR